MERLELKSYGEIEMPTRFDLIPGYSVLMETDTYPIREGDEHGWFTIHDRQDVEIGRWYFRVLDGYGQEKIRFVNLPSLYQELVCILKPFMAEGTWLKRCRINHDLFPWMPISPDQKTSFLF